MKRQRERRARNFLLWGGLLFFFAWTCHPEHAGESPLPHKRDNSHKKNRIILQVGNEVFLNSDLENYLGQMVGAERSALTPAALSRLYDKFVEEKILLMRAQNQKVTLSEEEKKEYLARLKNDLWTEDEKEAALEYEARALHEKLLVEKYLYLLVKDTRVEDAEIAAYYNLHQKEFFQSERIQVSQILLESEKKAIEVLNKLKSSAEEEFRKLAKEESVGPEASKGGMMGVFSLGQLPFEIEKVVFALKEGEVSPVLKSSYGYHIFKLDKRYEPKMMTKEEAAAVIKVKILDQRISQAIAAHVEELKKTVEWKSYPQNLSFAYQRTVS